VFAVLLLYVATWPVVEIKGSENLKGTVTTVAGSGRYPATVNFRLSPHWIRVVYQPMHFLYNLNRQDNLLAEYFHWWEKVLL
jgi:hypothetical protein